MIWVRKSLGAVFWVILFLSLIATALSFSANMALGKPQKLEKWINQSNLYGHFVNDEITQAKKSVGSAINPGSLTLSDTAVQQAANSAFTTSFFQQSVNTVIDSNYAWLEGKVSQPDFKITLADSKDNFANQVGQYVQAHIASLPACTPKQIAQLASIKTLDPLNITCKPPIIDPKIESSLVTQKILSNNSFLNNSVITPSNLNPNGNKDGQPYYQRLSKAPRYYQFAVKLAWVYGVIAILSASAVFFLAARKRFGLRWVAVALLFSGIILLIVGLLGNALLTQVDRQIHASNLNSQIQQSVTSIIGQAEKQFTKIDLYFALAYIAGAIFAFIILGLTHNRKPRLKNNKELPKSYETIFNRFRNDPKNSVPPPREPRPLPPEAIPKPRPKKRPRLIQ